MRWPFAKEVSQDAPVANSTPVKLDLGCGKRKKEGFLGIDRRKFEGVDGVTDLTKKNWIFQQSELGTAKLLPLNIDGMTGFILPDNSVSEVYCSHFLEHLEHNQRQPERARFMNELWRVLIPDGIATIITPHWASNRAYGDFTHADKPVTEMFYAYLHRVWREDNAPDNDIEFNPDGYNCDFEYVLGHGLHPDIAKQPLEAQTFALQWYIEAAEELHARLTAKTMACGTSD
jgi:SAM-dependent methyltransferase